jgi:FecR protein
MTAVLSTIGVVTPGYNRSDCSLQRRSVLRLAESSIGSILLCVAGVFASPLACAQSTTIVGIVEGGATLIRQTTRYTLAEGVALNDQDIVETAPGAFAQIELPGGVLVGLGESTRLMVRPRVGKGMAATPLFLLQGWLKTTSGGAFGYASPSFEIATQAGTAVVHSTAAQHEFFMESGAAKLTARSSAPATVPLGGGDFALLREGAPPAVGKRATPGFLLKVPRQFRDRLPARGEQLSKRAVAPKAIGPIAYGDVSDWLRLEPALRLPLLPLWKARAADPVFRAAAKENLAHHPEWEPYADPEGYARRLALEAERRRAREAARQESRATTSPNPPASSAWSKQ